MKIMIKDIRLSYNDKDNPELTLTLKLNRKEAINIFTTLKGILAKGKELITEIKQYYPGRSKDANSYCFVLCQKIAEVISNTKDFVYQEMIKRVGQFDIRPIRNDAVESHIERWNKIGLGWYAEVVGESKLAGYTNVISYYGSSTYNSKEMAILIDEIISECKELGIDVVTESEKNLLLREWGK